jgi:glutamate/tyrosine decarboxylase-like PLP-dependent enzyme
MQSLSNDARGKRNNVNTLTESNPSQPSREEIAEILDLVVKEATTYLQELDQRPVRPGDADAVAKRLTGSLPEKGVGGAQAIHQLIEDGLGAAIHNSGPRYFHFVVGGVTPAALGADWLATVLDQLPYTWVTSPLAVQLELVSLSWLKELFGLPSEWGGIITTGATMANFVGLAAARQWWGEQQGVDISQDGFAQLPKVPVFSSGYLHASVVKTLAMLGIGRSAIQTFKQDPVGRLDQSSLEQALRDLKDLPAIIVGNAGEVNAGDFDPIDQLADLAEKYGAWLHVDGAFGLFASITPQTQYLTNGVERAHSVTVDGHKWLNVPYDCGFSFVRDGSLMGKAFAYTGAYLPDPDDPQPNMGSIGPEGSRRARSLAVWSTLRAYGRRGYEALINRSLALAQRMAERVDAAPDLERLADVPLNIVCFRFNSGGTAEEELNRINDRLGQAILEDGRFYAGTTLYGEKVALRPAIVNWRTTEQEIDLFIDVVRELGARVALNT